MNALESGSDGRIDLLNRLRANANFTRTSRKTDPVTAQLASELEAYFENRIKELQRTSQKVSEPESVAA